jgi:hypothetical protein
MPQRPLAKKAQQTNNISGLRSQQRDSSIASRLSGHPTPTRSLALSPEGDESDLEEGDDDLDLLIHFDSYEGLVEWEGFGREDLAEVMVDMFDDDDPGGLDWLPTNLRAMYER